MEVLGADASVTCDTPRTSSTATSRSRADLGPCRFLADGNESGDPALAACSLLADAAVVAEEDPEDFENLATLRQRLAATSARFAPRRGDCRDLMYVNHLSLPLKLELGSTARDDVNPC